MVFLLVAALLLSGCAGKPAPQKPVSLQAVYAAMSEKVALPPMLEVDGELVLDFYGFEPGTYTQGILMVAEDSLIADEILLLEARDQASADALKELMQGRLDAKAAEAITYSPEQYAVIKEGHLVRDGLYLALIVSPDADQLLGIYREFIGGGG